MMSARLKGLVSKNKKRYQEDGFDLDLSYICDKIIAMGFPAEKLEGVYRNHIDDVVRFLDSKHKDHYKIYNLCCERQYDKAKFHGRVALYPFEDHNPPQVEVIKPFCEDVDKWLEEHNDNVVVIHCKAGKGRTGVMICAYLLHKQFYEKAEDALDFFGNARTHNSKGVTIPSQRRYVNYYGELVRRQLEYKPVLLLLHSISFSPIPTFSAGACPYFTVHHLGNKIFTSPLLDVKRNADYFHYTIPNLLAIKGDIKIVFYTKPKMMKKEKILQFWFNTFFVDTENKERKRAKASHNGCCGLPSWNNHHKFSNSSIDKRHFCQNRPAQECDPSDNFLSFTLYKEHLDKAIKDTTNKFFSADFKVELKFRKPAGEEELLSSSSTPQSNLHRGGHLQTALTTPHSDNEMVDDTDTEETDEDDDWGEESTHV